MKEKIAFVSLIPDMGHIFPLVQLAVYFKEHKYDVCCFLPEESAPLVSEYNLPITYYGKVTTADCKNIFYQLSRRSIFYNSFSAFMDVNLQYYKSITPLIKDKLEPIKRMLEEYNPSLIMADSHYFRHWYIFLAASLKKNIVFHDVLGNAHYLANQDKTYKNKKLHINGKCYRLYYNKYISWYGFTDHAFHYQSLILYLGSKLENYFYHKVKDKFTYPYQSVAGNFEIDFKEQYPALGLDSVKADYISTGLPFITKEIIKVPSEEKGKVSFFPPLNNRIKTVMDPSLEQWLHNITDKPVVFISLGTMVRSNKGLIKKILRGLKGLDAMILWVASYAEIQIIKAMSSLKNLRLEERVPQRLVLLSNKVKCFITHAGAGGVQEGLLYGKPMLCIPFMFDQPFNSSLVEMLGTGIKMWKHRVSAKSVHNALYKLLRDTQYHETAEKIRKVLQSLDGGGQVLQYLKNKKLLKV